VTQRRVSAIENGSVAELSTLADYIRALGGELKVIADFGDTRIRAATPEADRTCAKRLSRRTRSAPSCSANTRAACSQAEQASSEHWKRTIRRDTPQAGQESSHPRAGPGPPPGHGSATSAKSS
jgi:hypothetical protein